MSEPENVSVLIVDDQPAGLIALEAMLHAPGRRLVTAHSGREALRQLLQDDFAVILLDVQMPEMDGYQTAELIRERERSRDTPIIFLTAAEKSDANLERGYGVGAFDYVFKPVNPDILKTKVNVFVDLARRSRRVQKQSMQLLEQSKQMSRGLLEVAPDAMLVTDAYGEIRESNAETQKLFGYSMEELHGTHVTRLLADDSKLEYLDALKGEAPLRVTLSLSCRRKEGGLFPVDFRIADVQGSLVTSIRDVSEHKRTEKLLTAQRAELERSNRELQQFAYVASHDLRAPLRSIESLAGWIVEDLGDTASPDTRQNLALLRSRVTRMGGLLNDLLEYAKVGRQKASVTDVTLPSMLKEVVELSNVPADFKVELELAVDAVQTAEVLLKRVLLNLVVNAIKHHDQKSGRVVVRALDEGKWLKFEVSDDGPGIPPEHHERVFQLFQMLKSRDEVEGSGMGLSLVRKLVESSGGDIAIDSKGRGTTFRFRWPRVWPAEDQPPPRPSSPDELGIGQ